MRSRYRFEQFKKHNPEKFDTLINKVIADLNEIEKDVSLKLVSQKETHQGPKVKNGKCH